MALAASRTSRSRTALVLAAALLAWLAVPSLADAAVTVSRAEVNGDRLRIEGSAAPNRTITVDGVAMGTSDGSGKFRIDRSGFTPPSDCTVDVDDGSAAPVSVSLAGCTATSPPPAPSLDAVSVTPTTIVGGDLAEGAVTLTASAPAGGFPVALSSSNEAVATVPPGVTVPEGATTTTFPVTTSPVTNSQSSTIVAAADGVTRHTTITVVTEFQSENGSVSLARGGLGHGRVTSEPPGVDCTFTSDSTTGACNNVFFPAGTDVKLEARPADNSSFRGWEFEVSCRDAPEVTIVAGTAHICRPVFELR